MKFSTAIIVGLLLIASSAHAQVAPAAPAHQPGVTAPAHTAPPAATKPAATQTPAASDKPDPAKEKAIRHLMEITQTSKLGDNIGEYLTSQVRSVMSRNLSEDRLTKFMDAFNQKFAAAAPSGAVSDAMVGIYAHAFSMEDIQGLIQFYESPLGQRVVKELPDVVQQSQNKGVQIEQSDAMAVLQSMQDDYPELKPLLQPPAGGGAPGAAPGPAPAPTPVQPSK